MQEIIMKTFEFSLKPSHALKVVAYTTYVVKVSCRTKEEKDKKDRTAVMIWKSKAMVQAAHFLMSGSAATEEQEQNILLAIHTFQKQFEKDILKVKSRDEDKSMSDSPRADIGREFYEVEPLAWVGTLHRTERNTRNSSNILFCISKIAMSKLRVQCL
jgi:ribosome-associated translation inhibitor RaiA